MKSLNITLALLFLKNIKMAVKRKESLSLTFADLSATNTDLIIDKHIS
jgi:hypothetical protein